jgi:hypothetical protein
LSVHFALKAKVFRLQAQGEIESEGKNGDYQLRIVSPLKSERLPHLIHLLRCNSTEAKYLRPSPGNGEANRRLGFSHPTRLVFTAD